MKRLNYLRVGSFTVASITQSYRNDAPKRRSAIIYKASGVSITDNVARQRKIAAIAARTIVHIGDTEQPRIREEFENSESKRRNDARAINRGDKLIVNIQTP
jgi:hypothetical protein